MVMLVCRMVTEQVLDGKKVYVCNCGLIYDDLLVAYACDEYYKAHGKLSEDITKKAVNVPHNLNK